MSVAAGITVEIARVASGAGLPLPSSATSASAGLDIPAALPESEPLTLPPGQRALVPAGFALAIPSGWEGQIRPRSGLALRDGVTVLNAPGTIDADYRGEIGVVLINLGQDAVTIRRGERVAQLVFAPVVAVRWSTVANLDETERGAGGFGSTGRGAK